VHQVSPHASLLKTRHGGFSMIELAISLAVLAILMSGILVPLTTQVAQQKRTTTEKTLQDVREALLGFAAANGRLPCPAVDGASGVEAFKTTAPVGDETNGDCRSHWGFVPGRTLGITPVDKDGYVLDGWGTSHNRIRYAVAFDTVTVGTVNYTKPFTRIDGIRNATIPEVSKKAASATGLLHVCDSGSGVNPGTNCNTTRTLTSSAVAVIWSVGANAATGGTGTDEAQNPNPKNELSADRIFVSHDPSNLAANPFDDIVTWLSFNTLVNRMITAGQLP
jgi:prepilin-type N-terminal cleavage/methylation domain-containing protein